MQVLVRILSSAIAALFVAVGASGLVSWLAPEQDTSPIDAPINRPLNWPDLRSGAVQIDLGTRVAVEVTILTSAEDPLFDWEVRELYRDHPELILGVIGNITVSDRANGSVPIIWDPPASQTSPHVSGLILHGTTDPAVSLGGPLFIRYVQGTRLEPTVSFSTADGWVATGADPTSLFAITGESSGTTRVLEWHESESGNDPRSILEITAQRSGSVTATDIRQTSRDEYTLNFVAHVVWPLAPWAMLLFVHWLARRKNSNRLDGAHQSPWGLITGLVVALILVDVVVLVRAFAGAWIPALLESVAPWLPQSPSFAAPLAVSLTATIAAVALLWQGGGAQKLVHRWIVPLVTLVAAAGALLGAIVLQAQAGGVPIPTLPVAASIGLTLVGTWLLVGSISARWIPDFATTAIAVVLLIVTCAGAAAAIRSTESPPQIAAHGVFVVLTAALVALATWRLGHELAPAARQLRAVLVAVAILVIVLIAGPRFPSFNSNDALLNDQVLDYLFATIAGWLLVGLSMATLLGTPRLNRLLPRLVAVVAATFLLFRVTSVFVAVPWAALLGATLFALALLRPPADPLATLTSDGPVKPRVEKYLVEFGTRRIDLEFADGLRRKVRDGELSTEDEAANARAIIKTRHYGARDMVATASWRAAAFNLGGDGGPARRALFGLVVAMLAGLPFALPQVIELVLALDNGEGLITFQRVANDLLGLRFPFYGLALGFFFPVLRGATGLSKSIRLLIVLAATELVTLVLPLTWNAETQDAIILRGIQLLVVLVVTGIAFDIRTLRHAEFTVDRLGDVYSVNRLTVWGSGILLAAATTLGATVFNHAFDTLIATVVDQAPRPETSTEGK